MGQNGEATPYFYLADNKGLKEFFFNSGKGGLFRIFKTQHSFI
jgi:hypothetical protein